jgi:hypothetical protein
MSDVAVTPGNLQPLPAEDLEMGVSISLPFSYGWNSNENEILNPEVVTLQQLKDFRRQDGQGRALFRILTLPIRGSAKRFKVLPAKKPVSVTDPPSGEEEDSSFGAEEADFIYRMLTLPPHEGGMSVPMDRFFSQQLLALFDGFAAFEIVYTFCDRGPNQGKWVIRKLSVRPAETVTFLADKNGGFAGFRQRTNFLGREIDVMILPPYAYYYAAQEEENPFYGQSWFIPAFYHYDKKVKMYYVVHLAAQFRAVPGRVGKLPQSATSKVEKDNFRKALQDLGIAGAIMAPFGYEVDEIGTNVANFDFLGVIKHHNREMAKSVLAEFLDDEEKPSLIESDHSDADFFVMALEAIMGELESRINNHVIPNLIDWNFGTARYPQFRLSPLGEKEKAAIRATFDQLATAASINITPEFMLELEKHMAEQMALDIPYEEIEKRQLEEAQQQREAEAAMAKATVATANFNASHPQPEKQAKPPAGNVAASRVLSVEDLYNIALSQLADNQ